MCYRATQSRVHYVGRIGLYKDIETLGKSCGKCHAVKSNPTAAPLHPLVWPDAPWTRIHVGFARPFLRKMFLVKCRNSAYELLSPLSLTMLLNDRGHAYNKGSRNSVSGIGGPILLYSPGKRHIHSLCNPRKRSTLCLTSNVTRT